MTYGSPELRKSSMSAALLLTATLCLFPPGSISARELGQEAEQDPPSTSPQGASDESETPEGPATADLVSEGPCEVSHTGGEPRLDRFRRQVFETVCESAAWFDGFFGSRRFDEEARRTHGRVGAQLLWDEHDGFEVDGTLKVRVDFPNIDQRINAFLGRDDSAGFLRGDEGNLDFLPTFFESEGGKEWLLGLGYRPVKSDRSSLDFDAGIDAGTPLDPFVRAQYRYFWLVGDDELVRLRQTVYWTNQKDMGTGTRIDYERPLGSKSLGRWSTNFVFDSETDGTDWDTGVTYYHGFTEHKAIAWFAGIDGETGRDVPIADYGTRITYRQRMFRKWFFGELLTGVSWPRDNREEQRELAWHIGVGFEIFFSGEDLGLGSRTSEDQAR